MSIYPRVQYHVGHMSVINNKLTTVLAGAAARTALVLVVVILFIGYFFQISSLTTGGYEIAQLEQKTATLNEENEKLRAEIASYQSMNSIQKRLETLGMVKATNIKYVNITENSVAKR